MSAHVCPVCGSSCARDISVDARMVITGAGVVQARPRVPVQARTGRWANRASYVGAATGRVEVYDPEYPHVRLVQTDDDAVIAPASGDASNSGSDGGLATGDEAASAAAVSGDGSGERRRRRRMRTEE